MELLFANEVGKTLIDIYGIKFYSDNKETDKAELKKNIDAILSKSVESELAKIRGMKGDSVK